MRAIELTYGPDRARFKRIDEYETGLTTTRYIAGGSYEVAISAAGTVTAKLYNGGAAVVIDTETTPGTHTIATRYLLKDHLGSVQAELGSAKTVVTNEAGAVLERLSFDAWGRRREGGPDGLSAAAGLRLAGQADHARLSFPCAALRRGGGARRIAPRAATSSSIPSGVQAELGSAKTT